jgi:excisionase family DNA binding protein
MLDQQSPWKTRLEAAQYARVTVGTIDRWVRDGLLTRHTVSGTRSVRFHTDDLDKLMIPDVVTMVPST